METINEFIASNGLSAAVSPADSNPNMDDNGFAPALGKPDMDHWRVIIKMSDGDRPAKMTTYFSMGKGHHGKAPELADVLDCLGMDAASVENARDFADWCSEYGYDTDSRKAHRTYTICKRQAERLRKLLGINAYNDLLWETERL